MSKRLLSTFKDGSVSLFNERTSTFIFHGCNSGYNQISIFKSDEENTSFTTDWGTHCYKVMPFGLKNARVTYQRLVNRMLKEQIGRNMEEYMDDMLVKSQKKNNHLKDLEEILDVLRRY